MPRSQSNKPSRIRPARDRGPKTAQVMPEPGSTCKANDPDESIANEASTRSVSERQDRSAANLARLAALVADGELPLPLDLSRKQLQQVVCEVRRLRRRRLVRFIAQVIARDIYRAGEGSQ